MGHLKNKKVLFTDLDGTLTRTLSGLTFPKGVWDMSFRFDCLEAIKKLRPEYVCIVSNQGGIDKGFVNKENFELKAKYICCCISEFCEIDKDKILFCFCPSSKEDLRRKPSPGMLSDFYHSGIGMCLNINDKEQALMIGDASGKEGQWSDTDKKTAENFSIDYLDVEDFIKLMEEENEKDLS